MKKSIIITSLLVLILIAAMALTSLAANSEYTLTRTGFFYRGDVFHEKTVEVSPFKSSYQVAGVGTAQGSHEIRTKDTDGLFTANLSAQFYGATAPNAGLNRNMRILTSNTMGSDHTVNTGVEMDPGEEGYIKQTIAYSQDDGGEYVKIDNHYGNTGGVTKNEIAIDGYLNERMRVDGYAEVWQSTTVDKGGTKTGWWDINR
ncbi:MAG: hypothetical protein SCJ97_08840 [Bacillota bacterium]|nr:hypothetical protein [Bacillota bacterium]